jgi:autotransporter-associated beta strand protein
MLVSRGAGPEAASSRRAATTADGVYLLTLAGASAGIADGSGSQLKQATTSTWTLDTGIVVPAGQTVVDSTVRSGTMGITKRGAGTLVLTAAATFTGSAKLANASLKTAAKLYPGLAENQTNADYRVDWALGKAEGNLRVNALLKLPFGIKKSFSKSLGKFLNSSASGNLASGTTTLE